MRLSPGLSETLQEKFPLETAAGVPLQVTVETPEVASETVPVAVIGDAEKAAPSDGAVTVTVGKVSSMLSVTLAVAMFPAASVTVPLTIWPMPCDEIVCGPGQLTIAALPAPQLNVTVTLVLFQPFALGAGETEAEMEGGVAAVVTFRLADPLMAPLELAVITARPLPIPVLSPFAFMVAMLAADELQLTDGVRFCVLPVRVEPLASR